MGFQVSAWECDVEHWRSICAEISVLIAPRLAEVGDLLTGGEFDPDGDEQPTLDDYALALDAYAAAAKLAKEAEHPPELAGTLVLLDIAAARFQAASARHEGLPSAPRVFRCVENPLHGPAVNVPDGVTDLRAWHPEGPDPDSPRHPLCAACLRRRRGGMKVDWLPTPISDVGGGRSGRVQAVPYYAVIRPRTAWAATAYGNIRGATDGDLVARIQRGEHRITPRQARASVKRSMRATRSARPQVDLRQSGMHLPWAG